MVRGPWIILAVLVLTRVGFLPPLLRVNFVSENLLLNNHPSPMPPGSPAALEMQNLSPQI